MNLLLAAVTPDLAASRTSSSINRFLGRPFKDCCCWEPRHHPITQHVLRTTEESLQRTDTDSCLPRQASPGPSTGSIGAVSVSVVSVLQSAADPVLKPEPVGSKPSHSSSIIMGLACNPVTSRTWSGLRGQRPHSQTLSLYYKSQRGFIWTCCMLTSLCFPLLRLTAARHRDWATATQNIKHPQHQLSHKLMVEELKLSDSVWTGEHHTSGSELNTSLQNHGLWPGAVTRPLLWDGLLPDLGRRLLGFAPIESQAH